MRGAIDLSALAQAKQAQSAANSALANAPSGVVIDVDESDFQEKVIDASNQVPVIVDLWAEWCGPCKQLSPVLEKLAAEFNGKFILAKVDIDKNQNIAAAFQVQSIPAVFAIIAGSAAPLFQGAHPESQVRQVLTEVIRVANEQGVKGIVKSEETEEVVEKAEEVEEKVAIAEAKSKEANVIIQEKVVEKIKVVKEKVIVNQIKIQKPAVKSPGLPIHQKLTKSVRTEAVLGIILIGIVALLTNSSLPTSQAEQTVSNIPDGITTTVFSESLRFGVNITPLKTGTNTISISIVDSNGSTVEDLSELSVKVSNPQKNIAPMQIPLEKVGNDYRGEITFGFSGNWNIEIDAQRTNSPNESTSLSVLVKPRLSELKTDITEYTLPETAAPQIGRAHV